MDDLLGIEVDRLDDGSIKLHQTKYINKIVSRFLPDGPLPKSQRGTLPYSRDFLLNISDALATEPDSHPELLKDLQERLGCLMYAATSSRPDIAFPVHQLCKCLRKPTPAIIQETNRPHLLLSRSQCRRWLDVHARAFSLIGLRRCILGNARLYFWLGRDVAIRRALVGIQEAEMHRVVLVRGGDHRSVRSD